ncbi:hypothetical protein [Pseudoalteromonas denitrificans]|uniref:Uncharacterized protein n=1 Tax=Pseudoalteromonas denitrificans DSM 6059 TaxID=1123010 RepID=A0A1I1NYL1_9GAMM|nr:hypothetical protein [Pseudoalteromonas denitrificans]SFD00568.1 hypothetical protein SAMN02745724_03168 [Pseudoalteromonas denitrificans DSM 6059]
MSQEYKIIFQNNASAGGNVCVYQTAPTGWDSVSWFVKGTNPGTGATFDWTIDYGFQWTESGTLVPGVQFEAQGLVSAELQSNNKIEFAQNEYGGQFINQTNGTSGSLEIDINPQVPDQTYSTGVTMSGNGAFMQAAHPNTAQTFTPHPEYWITFGDIKESAVMTSAWMTAAAAVSFPANVYTMYVTLNADYTWTVSQFNSSELTAHTSRMKLREVSQLSARELDEHTSVAKLRKA